MAVTYNDITDGQSVETWAINQNTFGNSVKANIDTIETDITTLDANKIEVLDTGMIYTVTSTASSASLTTSYQKVIMTDSLSLNKANGHLTVNLSTGVFTFTTAGVYSIGFFGAMVADNGDDITFNYNLNGSSFMDNPPLFIGRGLSTPVAINSALFVEVTAGSSIYIEAKSNATSTMTPVGCGMSIEKTHY